MNGQGRLAVLELNCHRLICTFHQEPTTPVSQARGDAALERFVQHADRAREGGKTYLTSFMAADARSLRDGSYG